MLRDGSGRVQSHFRYFDDYFAYRGDGKKSARTIVVEHEYVDRDYLDDYVSYYSRSFVAYARTCTRLHFFTSSFNEGDFSSWVERGISVRQKAALQRNYLGFVVIKPLPETVFGRTCLRTYLDLSEREFLAVRRYASVFSALIST